MEYKKSVGFFVTGITFIIAGPLVTYIAGAFGFRAAFNSGAFNNGIFDPSAFDLALPFVGLAAVGGLLSIVGLILLVASAYRALVKIDALPVTHPSANW